MVKIHYKARIMLTYMHFVFYKAFYPYSLQYVIMKVTL